MKSTKNIIASLLIASLAFVTTACGRYDTAESTDSETNWVPAYYVLVVVSTGVTIYQMISSHNECMAKLQAEIKKNPALKGKLGCRKNERNPRRG